jgi:AmiR/NasT family two-component response regulator
MTSALVVCSTAPQAPDLARDLATLGIHVLGAVQRDTLVREAARLAPDVVVCFVPSPDEAWFTATSMLAASAPCAVIFFTQDPDAEKIERSVASGIHAYVVNGYAAARLRSLIHLATARFRQEQRLRSDLEEIGQRLEDRKLVDRAKGILMRARGMSEDEAFKVLRTASMHANQRVGDIARQVISAAGEAEGVNRSGQLRMLSQRIVKACAQAALDVEPRLSAELLAQSLARGDANLEALQRILSKPTFGDLIEAVLLPWRALKEGVSAGLDARRLAEIDALAERLLQQSDQLTSNLQATGVAPSLEVINVSGRQRMLSQRLAKLALLHALHAGDAADGGRLSAMAQTREEFERAMNYLRGIPLSTPRTRDLLAQASGSWERMEAAVLRAGSPAGRAEVARESETLLRLFEELTEQYEGSMQVLLG